MIETYPRDEQMLVPLDDWEGSVDAMYGGNWPPTPGDRVVHYEDGNSNGMIVGVSDEEISVLWAREPRWLRVYRNGMLMRRGDDYEMSQEGAVEFKYDVSPEDVVHVDSGWISRRTALRMAGLPDAEDVPARRQRSRRIR